MPNVYDFTNTGTFTNNGVLKAKTVTSITNNKMVITNACPIFTLGGTNNYTVSGIFTEAAATTSAGTYTSTGNKFTANNTIPTGSQTLYAQVTDGTCTFIVPFDFNNTKPTAVSASTDVCSNASKSLVATCTSGDVKWYDAAGTTLQGTGSPFNTPNLTVNTTYKVRCETTGCQSAFVDVVLTTKSFTLTAGTAVNPTTCTGTNGSIPFTTNLADGTYTLNFTKAGATTTANITVTTGAFTLGSLSTGAYTAFAITSGGCTGSDAAVKTLTDPTAPTITAGTAVNPTTCSGTNGSIPFTTNLANGTYSLSYTGIGTPKNITVTNGAFSLSGLSAGAYSNFSVINIGCTATDASSKTLSDPPAVLATNYQAMTLNFAGTINQIFNTSTCNILLALTPNGGSPIAGNVEAKVWIGSPAPTYVGRKFEITPATNPNTATAKVTLFVLQSEFTTYNNQSPTPTRLLPANPTDAAGIANVFIFKKAGTSSDNSGNPSTYAGAVTTIDPIDTDIIWNNTESRWEISFQVSGFSGFVIGTPPLGCNLPNITQEPIGQKICNGQGFSLSVTANSATSYQWELNGVAIVGANANAYAIPVVAANQLGTYTVVISNVLATCAVRSANAIVEAKVSHFLQFQGCNCGGGGPLKVSIVGGTSPYSFDYMTSGGPSTFANYLSGATVTLPQNITQGRAISVTDAQGCKSID
jgi:hypothetical protein